MITNSTSRPEPIAVSAKEAARMLSISERTLFSLSHPRGPLRVVRIGAGRRRMVRYHVRDLTRFLDEHRDAPDLHD